MAYNDDKTLPGATITGTEWNTMTGVIDGSANFVDSLSATTTEINYLSGVTSAIQTQLNNKANNLATINTISTSTYSLASTDSGDILSVESQCTVTLPNGMDTGFQCVIVNGNSVSTNDVIVTASGTLRSKDSKYTLGNQYGAATAVHKGSNVWYLFGDLS